MERPAELELGRLATPEEDCEYDDPEEKEEEKKVEQKEEEEEEKETDETVTKEEKEHAVGEVEEEEEDEEEDVKKGEKVSLLEGRASPPLSSANTSMNTSELPRVTETVVVLPNPYQASLVTQAAQARLSPPDPDIQLAEADLNPPHFRTRRLPSSNLTHLSSIHTVCGPRPARITAGCLLVLSLWAAFMLLIHMNKKIDNLSTSLESTNDKLKTMEEVSEEYRSQALQRLQNMGKLIHSLKRRGRPPPGSESGTISPLLSKLHLPASSQPPTSSSTSPPIKSTTTEDDGWDVDWASSIWS